MRTYAAISIVIAVNQHADAAAPVSPGKSERRHSATPRRSGPARASADRGHQHRLDQRRRGDRGGGRGQERRIAERERRGAERDRRDRESGAGRQAEQRRAPEGPRRRRASPARRARARAARGRPSRRRSRARRAPTRRRRARRCRRAPPGGSRTSRTRSRSRSCAAGTAASARGAEDRATPPSVTQAKNGIPGAGAPVDANTQAA